jgi:cell division protein FtsB
VGYGSAGTPPWVDEKRVEEDKQKQKDKENLARRKALEKENEALKKRVAELEAAIKKKNK